MVLPSITPKPVPDALWEVLVARGRLGWSGTIALNMKDGRIVAFEVTEKHRVEGQRP